MEHFEEFCKPQGNEVRAHFDLLTSFRQGTRSVDEWYNTVQAQINLAKYSPETAKILHRDIFCFFLKDEEIVSKTVNEWSVDLDRFPASKLCQLAKKMESCKTRTRHTKQVAGDPQVAQINLIRYQHTELSNGKYKKKKSSAKQKQGQHKNIEQRPPSQYRKGFDPKLAHKNKDRCSKCGDSAHLEGFQCQAKTFKCKACHKCGHYTSPCFQKTQQKQANYKHRKPTAHQLKAGTIHVHDSNEEADSSGDSFCLQLKIQHAQAHNKMTQKPACLITNLAYRLKQHENRNLYLRARLDTCADMNIMPASVYRLVFRDPNLEKLVPSKLQIGTYTNDTVKIVGTCKLYVVHLDTKKLVETTFCVANNDGSMLLSCNSTLALNPIQPRSRLDYLPPRASLITSTQDHPKKTKEAQPAVHRSQQVATQSKQQVETTKIKKQQPSKLIISKDQIMA